VSDAENPSLASDRELVEHVAAGDRTAEAELYSRLAPRVRLYGLRHFRDAAAAEDLVQDVLLLTFDSLRTGQVRDFDRFASFVLGTCRRVVVGLRRGAERRRRLLERHGPHFGPESKSDGPLLDLDRLARCLSRLSERERTLVVLSFYAERSAQQIGTELGVSTVNVRVMRHRALARLRTCMEVGS
jgi:RNA polymerase sigma-70 factor (ECF subfamily)